MAREWNFVEHHGGKSSGRHSYMTKEERRLFSELKDIFQVEDTFPPLSQLKFSWDSCCTTWHIVMSRLDWFYNFSSLAHPTSGDNYQISGDCVHADQLPVWRQLRLAVTEKRSSLYVMNAIHLQKQVVQEGVR